MLIDRFKKAMEGGSDLAAIARKVGKDIRSADNVALGTPYVVNLGMELAYVAWASTLKAGEMSSPFKGEMGVYVIKVTSVTPAPEGEDYSGLRDSKLKILQSRASYEVFNALKEKADIVDNRGKFY
jgi:parvulin-like peptidyl-prolyl isomerase